MQVRSGALRLRYRLGRQALAVVALVAASLLPAAPVRALDPDLSPERYTLTRWTADDGLPHSQIHAITQGDDGFLWLSSWEGTARFDGHAFRLVPRLRAADGRNLPSGPLWRDADGSVLAGVEQMGLMRVPVAGAAQPACRDTPELAATRIVQAPDGTPWIVARDGIYRLEAGRRCTRIEGVGGVEQEVLGLLPRADGSLWIGDRRGLYRWSAQGLEPLGEQMGLPAGEVRALREMRDGSVWLVGDRGVWRVRDGRLEQLRSERAEGLLEDRQGAIWIAATDATLLRYWRGAWASIEARHGLEGYATGALYEDREGLLWLGTTHGLFRIADGPVWAINRQSGSSSVYVRSLLQARDGAIWIGYSGGLGRYRADRIEPVRADPAGRTGTVMALAQARDGGIWAGTYNRGVHHLAPGTNALRPLDREGPLATAQVRTLLEDPDGTLWIGTERGLVAWREGRLDPQPLPGVPQLPVRGLHRSPDGALWIGLLGGLARHAPDAGLTVFAPGEDYPAGTAFDFLSDPDGTLWIASERGLVRHRAGRFRLFGATEGLGGGSMFRVLDDGLDHLWVSSNRGVARIPRDALQAIDAGRARRVDLQLFGRDDGMPSRQANGASSPAGWRMDNGQLWIPTASGIAVFDPARVARDGRAAVPLVVDRVVVDGEERPAAALNPLPAGARLSIHYAGISLRNPGGLLYRYRMRGFDRDWVEAGQAREAAYTNLPAGRQVFEVQVARAPADWSRPASTAQIEFEVAPPWWGRTWFLALAFAGVLALLFATHQWLGRRERRRARRLESQVAQRTEELHEKHRQLQDVVGQREELLEQLAYQASHDALTGLPNRRAGDDALEHALREAEADATPLSVAIIDIDRFKAINDRHGHHVGDRVLARVATQLQATLRPASAFVGRNGGEEFLAVMRRTALPRALDLLERARADVAALAGDEAPACTVSIGVVERHPGEDADALLQRADLGLYAAKREGRDRVVAA